MKSHRKSELTDSHWLRDLERSELKEDLHVHGEVYRDRRDATSTDAGLADVFVPSVRAYRTWILGLSMFGLAAILIIVATLFAPNLLD